MPPLHLTIAGVCERDLDLFFLEELSSSAAFSRWFLEQTTTGVGAATLIDVRRSVTQSTGESDLEATFELADGSRLRLLIENKIDAGLQVDQALRYRQRASDYVAQGRCESARTVLVAPARYFGGFESLKGFDARLTYEQVLDRINDTELGVRAHYKRALLGGAIEKSTLGYQVEADAPVTEFWRAYWRMARDLAPELDMAEPIAKPSRAYFISLRSPVFPRKVEICHKLPHGNVDLQFGGWGGRIPEFRQLVEPYLAPGMTVARANKSASIRLTVAPLNTARGFAEQEAAAGAGIRAAGVLLVWWRANRAELNQLVG
jgi:hypothetical protein